jgi:Sigma-70, region 4
MPGVPNVSARVEDIPSGQEDLALDLERDELADLLDRALALLPPETRRVLVEKYVEELPVGEIAARLGLSTGAIAVRLHRGRLALHRVLATDLRQEAASYGLAAPAEDGWQETRIWCPLCGQHRLTGRFVPAAGELALRCPACTLVPDTYIAYAQLPELMHGIKSYKPALSRLLTWSDAYYRQRLADRIVPCMFCGHPSQLRDGLPGDIPDMLRQISPLYIKCERCGEITSTAHAAIALCLPEGQRFWKVHPRIQLQSCTETEAAGSRAIVSRFASVTDSARFDVVTTRDTVEVIAVHKYP